MNAKDGLV